MKISVIGRYADLATATCVAEVGKDVPIGRP